MVNLLLAVIYLAFISLGLPDSLLGAAWPVVYPEFGVPVSYAGILSTIICAGTITSSLLSGQIVHRFGAGRVTAFSGALTVLGIFGFSSCGTFWQLCLCAVPYGLGAGGVDAALNNYTAIHYSSRHMSWLHCMWSLGAAAGPYVMSYALAMRNDWHMGYRYIGLIQLLLTAIFFLSIPLWMGQKDGAEQAAGRALSLRQVVAIPGVKQIILAFFCYCSVENTAILWGSSYLVLHTGLDEEAAAAYASLFLIGITLGRMLSGFLTVKFSDIRLIRLGQAVIALGVVTLLLPIGVYGALAGLALIGLGCAPIYPCIIHSSPAYFGVERSQSVIGVQMAGAYVGSLAMPPLFGLIARHITPGLLPWYLLVLLAAMVLSHETLVRRAR